MDKTAKNDWNRIRHVFEDVLQHPADERRRYARELCGTDEYLWDEVRSLLDWHESSESFLETPAVVQVVEDIQLPDQLIAGQRLLHYEIQKLIGKGGMGEVYLAHDTRLDRNVAVKLLRNDLLPHVHASERLLREARAAALLEHPNICHIHEISEADGFNFIVMQYVVGTTLDDILTCRGVDVGTALDLGTQIAKGLGEAHARGIIHRDIKPANIIVSEKGQAKILDFGLAKFIEAETSVEAASRMQSSGGVMGTVPYMSPEQLLGDRVDARTDVFSFGALLYEMLSGVPAFRGKNNAETISAILREEPDWSLLSPVLRPVLQRCLAKEKAGRYASAGELTEAIAKVRNYGPIENPTSSNPTVPIRIDAVTQPADLETLPLYPWQSGGDEILRPSNPSDAELPRPSKSRLRGWLAIAASVFAVVVVAFTPLIWQQPPQSRSTGASGKLYWELPYTDKRKFILSRVMQIQTLIGDDQRRINDESLDGISKEINWYISRRDSLSQEPFKEGLRVVYGRASHYVPLVSAEFDEKKVPTAVGIYQAIVESEYRDCLTSNTGPVGIFQFTEATAQQYGLAAQDRCRVDLSSKAAATYNSKLLSNLGGNNSSWTLAVLSFNQGMDMTRTQIDELGQRGTNEKNYWVISENRERLSNYDPESDRYVRRFFAAAIIGENPEMFGLVTPPLSTIRTRTDGLGALARNALVIIPGGSFNMGRNDSVRDLEKPEHPESVDGFRMNKTEVTNTEFAEFISATGYKPEIYKSNFVAHWENGHPLETDENTPVRFVNLEDIDAFIKWKSQIDGIQYRLPTEKEWEYAARNGSKNNLYPWGDKFDARCAFVDEQRNEPVAVGTHSCPNTWGVHDLIGNVIEWTSSERWAYPGSPYYIKPSDEKRYIVRGGSAAYKSTGPNAISSTFRTDSPAMTRHPALGFRLVTSQ